MKTTAGNGVSLWMWRKAITRGIWFSSPATKNMREVVSIAPLTPPKVDSATKTDMIHHP